MTLKEWIIFLLEDNALFRFWSNKIMPILSFLYNNSAGYIISFAICSIVGIFLFLGVALILEMANLYNFDDGYQVISIGFWLGFGFYLILFLIDMREIALKWAKNE